MEIIVGFQLKSNILDRTISYGVALLNEKDKMSQQALDGQVCQPLPNRESWDRKMMQNLTWLNRNPKNGWQKLVLLKSMKNSYNMAMTTKATSWSILMALCLISAASRSRLSQWCSYILRYSTTNRSKTSSHQLHPRGQPEWIINTNNNGFMFNFSRLLVTKRCTCHS